MINDWIGGDKIHVEKHNNSMERWKAIVRSGLKTSEQQIEDKRCGACNYVLYTNEYLECSGPCKQVFHSLCVSKEVRNLVNAHLEKTVMNNYDGGIDLKAESVTYVGIREKEWRCRDCSRCTNCLSLKNREEFVTICL
jgi:hypothetical protein